MGRGVSQLCLDVAAAFSVYDFLLGQITEECEGCVPSDSVSLLQYMSHDTLLFQKLEYHALSLWKKPGYTEYMSESS